MDDGTEESEEILKVSTASNAKEKKSNGNTGNNGNGNVNTSTRGNNDNNGNANGNTNNTGGSTNQSGILFPIDGEVFELEAELIGMIKTTGKEKNYELVEYVNDVNREHVEVLMELNINGIMDTTYSYGNERLTNERFTEWTGYYTYDPRGSVTGVTDSKGMIWQSYRYSANGDLTFGKPQYNNVYSYNAESYNPNMESQYLRARYYNVPHANFLTEDSYLGNITDPLTLNRYNYTKSSPVNYTDPSGHFVLTLSALAIAGAIGGVVSMSVSIYHQVNTTGSIDIGDTVKATLIGAAGGVIGTVTAALVGTGLAAAGVTGAFTASQAFAIGATTAAVSGMAVRANSSLLVDGLNPNPNPYHNSPLDSLNTAMNHALDPRLVAIDTLMGGVSSALWYKVNEAINKEQTEDCVSNDKGEAASNKTNLHELKSQSELSEDYFNSLTNEGRLEGGGRSGGNLPIEAKPNSYYTTDKGHVIIYGKDGRRAMDISAERIKIEKYNVNPKDPSQGSWSSWKLKDSSGLVDKTEQWILDYFGI